MQALHMCGDHTHPQLQGSQYGRKEGRWMGFVGLFSAVCNQVVYSLRVIVCNMEMILVCKF